MRQTYKAEMQKSPPTDKGIRFRITPKRPLLVVRVEVNEAGPFNFIVDTGASSSVITPRVAETIGLRSTGKNPLAVGAGGPVEARAGKLKSLRLAHVTVRNLSVAVMDLKPIQKHLGVRVAGIVGHDVLRNCVVTIDYPAGRLYLAQVKSNRKPAR
jgi:predicted aspartyl protease